MNTLLIFFALPIATIIISIALQKILKSPLLVAAIIFAIFLIVTFIINNLNLLVATIVYTIISFITASIVYVISKFIRDYRQNSENNENCGCASNNCCSRNCERNNSGSEELLTISSNCSSTDNGNLLTISSNGCNGNTNDLLTVNTNCNNTQQSNQCCNNNEVTARINVIPNNNTNGRTGCVCGSYRRR